jgi:hypothetical protein
MNRLPMHKEEERNPQGERRMGCGVTHCYTSTNSQADTNDVEAKDSFCKDQQASTCRMQVRDFGPKSENNEYLLQTNSIGTIADPSRKRKIQYSGEQQRMWLAGPSSKTPWTFSKRVKTQPLLSTIPFLSAYLPASP